MQMMRNDAVSNDVISMSKTDIRIVYALHCKEKDG